jgi:hypothetical protein
MGDASTYASAYSLTNLREALAPKPGAAVLSIPQPRLVSWWRAPWFKPFLPTRQPWPPRHQLPAIASHPPATAAPKTLAPEDDIPSRFFVPGQLISQPAFVACIGYCVTPHAPGLPSPQIQRFSQRVGGWLQALFLPRKPMHESSAVMDACRQPSTEPSHPNRKSV